MAVTFVGPDGSRHERELQPGASVMSVARSTGVQGIIAECGGNLTCASCHVMIDDDWADQFPAPSADEDEMLDEVAIGRCPTSRLSCQLVLGEELDGLVVHLPDRQR